MNKPLFFLQPVEKMLSVFQLSNLSRILNISRCLQYSNARKDSRPLPNVAKTMKLPQVVKSVLRITQGASQSLFSQSSCSWPINTSYDNTQINTKQVFSSAVNNPLIFSRNGPQNIIQKGIKILKEMWTLKQTWMPTYRGELVLQERRKPKW